jgi:hypothetical protein
MTRAQIQMIVTLVPILATAFAIFPKILIAQVVIILAQGPVPVTTIVNVPVTIPMTALPIIT